MVSRERRNTISVDVYRADGTLDFSVSELSRKEIIHESRIKRGISEVVHRKLVSVTNGSAGVLPWGGRPFFTNHTMGGDFIPLPKPVHSLIANANFSQLAGEAQNNEFELLNFISEIDETFAMFSTKFLKSLSYGSVTWGLLPFIADVKSFLTSLQDIMGKHKTYPHCTRVSRRKFISYDTPFNGLSPRNVRMRSFSGTVRSQGVLVYTPPDLKNALGKALFLLDELGVHPDLKTAWDLIPFSFVVDYFLPIGDLIESLHPRGWGSSTYSFTGYQSVKGTYEAVYEDDHYVTGTNYLPAIWQYYERSYLFQEERPLPVIEFTAPSMKEIFNVGYLASLSGYESKLLRRK